MDTNTLSIIGGLITGTASGTVIALIMAWSFSKRDEKSRAAYETAVISQVKIAQEMADAFKQELDKCQVAQENTQKLVIELIKDNASLKTKVEYLEKKSA